MKPVCLTRPHTSAQVSGLLRWSHATPCHATAGVYKPGGQASADGATLQVCVEAARLRHRELASLLRQALQATGVPGYSERPRAEG